jgi:predicted MFS family arabinose efflux permease
MAAVTEAPVRAPGYRDLFAVREYTALWSAQLVSILGDQLARVALTVLVYDRTRSAFLAAVAFAASVLPVMASGVLLGQLADRFPRRAVMIACDASSLVLVALTAVPGMPLAALIVLIAAVAVASEPFRAARAAVNREVLGERLYPIGLSVTQGAYQAGQVAGYAIGGLIVAAAGVRSALAIDAATFAASAVIIRFGTRQRPAAAQPGTRPRLLSGVHAVLAVRVAAVALAIDLIASFTNSPEGVAVPLASWLGHGPAVAGLLLAAMAAGSVAGMTAAGRLARPEWLTARAPVLAALSCLLLAGFAFRPGLAAALVLLAASGACSAWMIGTGPAFARAVPDSDRGKAFGAANAAMVGGQGIMILIAGALAAAAGPAAAIAICGAAGTAAAIPAGLAWRRARAGAR